MEQIIKDLKLLNRYAKSLKQGDYFPVSITKGKELYSYNLIKKSINLEIMLASEEDEVKRKKLLKDLEVNKAKRVARNKEEREYVYNLKIQVIKALIDNGAEYLLFKQLSHDDKDYYLVVFETAEFHLESNTVDFDEMSFEYIEKKEEHNSEFAFGRPAKEYERTILTHNLDSIHSRLEEFINSSLKESQKN